ncbi:MAG: EAL domain-containing protein [Thiomicrorhabdus sp.]|nr:EAL domain-containing protein [Thiomicrorhabdus sp.]
MTQSLNQTSIKQRLVILILGLFWLSVTVLFTASHQYDEHKEQFQQFAIAFANQQDMQQKRAETILGALSEYYTSQTIKSHDDFKNFAQGLFDSSDGTTIGLADLISRDKKSVVESNMRALGYESFTISNRQLFKEQNSNDNLGFLTVTMVSPLDPKRSIYLSEDLFSIPNIISSFQKAIKHNQPQTLLLTDSRTNQIQKMIFTPIFLNPPGVMSYEQRLKQVRGAIFVLQPFEQNILQQTSHFFDVKYNTICLNQAGLTKVLQESHNAQSPFLQQLINIPFTTSVSLPTGFAADNIEITNTWNLLDIKPSVLLIATVISLLLYSSLVVLILTLIRYTQNLRITQTRLSQIIETSQDAVVITNEEGYIIDWNPEAEELFKYSKSEALGKCIVCLIFESNLRLNDDDNQSKNALIEFFYDSLKLNIDSPNDSQKAEVILHDRLHKSITAEVATSVLYINNKTEISLFIKDITYQRQTEEAMSKMAYFDSLTQLENRTYFKTAADQLVIDEPDSPFALLFLDLDGFKQVNDTLGHNIGDELLKVVAKRIQNSLRSNHGNTHICRFGGDEFVILLKDVGEANSAQISLRILNQIERTIKIDDDELQVSASIGIALYPDHGKDVDTLLRHADTAMYQSKALGKNTYSHYNDAMEESIAERSLIEKHLRKAIDNDEFHLVYQPQINLETGVIIGVEALIRWENPILGFVPPDKFIPIAEESQLILSIGEWVTKACISQLQAWKDTEFDSLHIAMNVSSVQFESPYFLGFVRKLMELSGIHNHLLEIELTERTVMNNVTENINRFNQIRSSGFGLSVDDFGTGYSSLSYLKKFPLSILKIDKSFIDGIPVDEEDIIITTAILNLAHSLSMKVVAEGVETKEQLMFLQKLKCNIAQGYYISPPLNAEALELWLKNNKRNFFAPHSALTIETQDA